MLTGTRCGFCSISLTGYRVRAPRRGWTSDVEVPRVERVFLDELATRLDLVAHEGREDDVGFDGVLDLHLEERPRAGIHGRLPELRGVHLSEALVTLDLEPLPRLRHDARDGLLEVPDL